ncbi:uncharacterized protein [Spinacia oleracea]|uniref:CCHC-type domain-containing protein n=1 Tax=Spinacia oleracea TaxID=3562 RepID=A0A9R0JGW5_SPIOL|nr:uncharacterized protein LOC110805439 [Spinacia oleracea]
MGKCLGLSIKSSYMEARVRAMWRIKGTLEIIDVGKGVFYFRFSTEEDYEKALFGGPWFILDHYLMLTTWKPNFRPSLHNFDKIMVWARFSELPVEYYDKEALFCIAGLVGKPIRVDYATDKITRARYARVCIEVDLDKPLITRVWVGGEWQIITYENLDTLCFECGRIGHVKQNCLNKKHLDQSSPYTKDFSSNDCNNQERGNNGSIEEGLVAPQKLNNHTTQEYGPWTLVTNKKYTKQRIDSYKGRLGGTTSNNSKINDYGKKSNNQQGITRINATISSKNAGDLPSSSSAQSTKQLQWSTNNFMIQNNEENLFSISTSKHIKENSEFQHVAPSSKPLGDDTLAVDALNPCSTPTNKTSNSPKHTAVSIPHSPSSTLSLSSPKKQTPFSSSSSVSHGVRSKAESLMHGDDIANNNHLSTTTSGIREKEGLLQDSGQYPVHTTGGSLGTKVRSNPESISLIADVDMHDQERNNSNVGRTEEQFENPQLSQLQRPSIFLASEKQGFQSGEKPEVTHC